jgi:hypothetical protein
MMRSKIFLGVLAVALMAATAGTLLHMKANQRLGEPGVKTQPKAGSKNLEILMPDSAPGFTSEIQTNNETIMEGLPSDTSFRCRLFTAPDNFWAQMTTVLMGSDRTSIHSPYICMTGQGWLIDNVNSTVEPIRMEKPFAYDLPVNKLLMTKMLVDKSGRSQAVRGLFIYWYVDGAHYTANSKEWMAWWMPRDLLLHGVLERWAYISVFAPCLPGQEAAAYERLKKLIASTVPEFQLVPHAAQ